MQQQNIIMSTLLSGLRTGNPLADAMITSLLFGAMTLLCAHVGAWWKALVDRLFTPAAPTVALSRITAPLCMQLSNAFGSNGKDWFERENQDFLVLTWFMTKHVPVVRGTAVVTRYGMTGTVLPDRSQVLPYVFEDRTVKFSRLFDVVAKKDDASSTVNTNERVEMTVAVDDGVPLLLRLLDKARKEYMESTNRVEWKQKLFRLSVASTGVKFNSALTHSTKSFETIVLDADVKADLVDDVAAFLAGEAWYASMGLSYKRGYLLHGPPGTGKSSIVLAISSMAKADIYSLNLSVLKTDLDLDAAFAALPERCVVVFEDVDCMGSVVKARTGTGTNTGNARGGKAALPAKKDDAAEAAEAGGSSSSMSMSTNMMIAKMVCSASASFDESVITLSCLLNHLDGAGSNHGRIFVMTTNHPGQLDPALIRPGRTDVQLRLGMCSRQQIGLFFELFYPGVAPPPSLLEIPGDVLSPAEVSCAMLQFRRDPRRAVEKLGMIARKDPTKHYI
jgi:hypothetical protein